MTASHVRGFSFMQKFVCSVLFCLCFCLFCLTGLINNYSFNLQIDRVLAIVHLYPLYASAELLFHEITS